ncbi:EamA family transporter RarD [Desulfovibrio sp. OttesenSCG-928-O18]|nr:EamA family transporter RarD [Desulfovibrio sp. OttesenSCG-928-O18]
MRAQRFISYARSVDPGFWATLASSLIWGTLPLYWKLLQGISPYLVLCHRIVWSCVFLLPLVIVSHRMKEVVKAAKNAKVLRGLFCSSIILATNWGIFIWAVNNGKVLESSLGYYINPLLNICMGVLLFRDRPSRMRMVAIAIAFMGVGFEVIYNGVVPWVALSLALLFSAYGLLRKLAPVESLPGLFLETVILCPFALAFVLWNAQVMGPAAWGTDTAQMLLLMGTGVITSVPLILFSYGARHIPFTTLGILQYISPTMTFLFGLFVFKEEFAFGRAVSFSAIWLALTIYTVDSLRSLPSHIGKEGIKPATPDRADPE